jgi:hypothetical protein
MKAARRAPELRAAALSSSYRTVGTPVWCQQVEAYEATRQRHIERLLPQIGEHFERVAWTPSGCTRSERRDSVNS